MTSAMAEDPLAQLLAMEDAAVRLKVHKNTLYRMIRAGKIAAIKHGNQMWIEHAEMEDYFARQRAEGQKLRVALAKRARQRRGSGRAQVAADETDA